MGQHMVLLTAAFRLFFPAGALFAALALPLWLLFFAGVIRAPHEPLVWHMHEMLFGYLPAVLTGFLLTAIPNWTRRPAIKGAPLAALFVLWLAGRVGLFAFPETLPATLIALAYLPVLILIAGREIVLAGNRRNLIVVALLALLSGGEVLFFFANQDFGLNTGFAAAFLLMMLIAGRVTPAFTRNWLMQRKAASLPAGFGRTDQLAMGLSAAAMLLWIIWPTALPTGFVAAAAAGALLLRQTRWRAAAVAREPLLLALHAAYFWLPVALALLALSALTGWVDPGQTHHAIGAGAIGGMTMIMALRAVLGHSGRPITGTVLDWLMLGAVHLGAELRIAALWSGDPQTVYLLAGTLWAAGFALFVLRILPIALAPRR